MITKKELLDNPRHCLFGIESYQNEIISCLEKAGVGLGKICDALEDASSEVSLGEEMSDLLDTARWLEGWAIGHHQVIQELGGIMKQIEETQNRKPGGKK